jgi:hypothetical protein
LISWMEAAFMRTNYLFFPILFFRQLLSGHFP